MSEISLRERIRLNLVSAMDSAGLNQVQLADKLGISKGTVNNWIRGNNSPDVDMVPRICKVLDISISSLYAPTSLELKLGGGSEDGALVSNEELAHIKKYRALDERGKEIVDLVLDVEFKHSSSEVTMVPIAARGHGKQMVATTSTSEEITAALSELEDEDHPEL